VTTAGNWPQWHPSSLDVSGAVDHSGLPGEQVTEQFLVAGRRGSVTWTVRERQAPYRWMINGVIHGRTNGGAVGAPAGRPGKLRLSGGLTSIIVGPIWWIWLGTQLMRVS